MSVWIDKTSFNIPLNHPIAGSYYLKICATKSFYFYKNRGLIIIKILEYTRRKWAKQLYSYIVWHCKIWNSPLHNLDSNLYFKWWKYNLQVLLSSRVCKGSTIQSLSKQIWCSIVNEVSSNTLQQDSLYKFGSNLLCVFIIQLQHHFGSCIIYILKGHNSTNSFKKNLVFELPSPYIIDLNSFLFFSSYCVDFWFHYNRLSKYPLSHMELSFLQMYMWKS
jgi:hypothetical protein